MPDVYSYPRRELNLYNLEWTTALQPTLKDRDDSNTILTKSKIFESALANIFEIAPRGPESQVCWDDPYLLSARNPWPFGNRNQVNFFHHLPQPPPFLYFTFHDYCVYGGFCTHLCDCNDFSSFVVAWFILAFLSSFWLPLWLQWFQ